METHLVIWKDEESCRKYYKNKDYLIPEEIPGYVKRAMEYGSLIKIEQEALEAFKKEYNALVY